MEMTAADIMQPDFPFVDCDVTVAEAEELFEQEGLAALPVLNPDRTVFGLLTPKNLAHFHGRPLNNPRAFHAWEICDARPLLTAPSGKIDDVAAALLNSSAGHILIINDEQQLVGVISTATLLQHNLLVNRNGQEAEPEVVRGLSPGAAP